MFRQCAHTARVKTSSSRCARRMDNHDLQLGLHWQEPSAHGATESTTELQDISTGYGPTLANRAQGHYTPRRTRMFLICSVL